MKVLALLSVLCVAIANVAMNILVRSAAVQSPSYSRALTSRTFALALVVGTCSVVTLLLVYRLNVNLSQGILLMGAASIVGGSLIGVFVFRTSLHAIEWLLLAVMVLLFVFRWVSKEV